MLTYIAELSIGALMPGVFNPFLLAVGDLQARVDALAAFSAQVGLDFGAQISLAESIIANIQAAIAIGLSPPTISAQVSIMAATLAELEAQLTVMLGVPFATAGVHVYVYDGTAAAFGADVTAALSGGFPGGTGGAQHCNAIILATTIGATWTDMQAVFKTTP